MDLENPIITNTTTNKSIEVNHNPFTIGRGLTCNYLITTNPVVSRVHCELEKIENVWYLRDKSSNGTYVNGFLVHNCLSPPLKSSDVIQLSTYHKVIFQIPHKDDTITDEQLCRIADSVLETIEIDSDTSVLASTSTHESVDSSVPSKKLKIANPSTSTRYSVVDLTEDSFRSESELFCDPSTSSNVKSDLSSLLPTTTDDNFQIVSSLISPLKMVIQKVPGQIAQSSKTDCETASTSNTIMGQIESRRPQDDDKMVHQTEFDDELQCAICSEMFVKASTLNCSHTFCKYCIDTWKQKQTLCPICRAKITSQVPTLVLDNYIDKIIQNSSKDVQDRRKELLEDRLLQIQSKPKTSRGSPVPVEQPELVDLDDTSSSSDSLSTLSDSEQDEDWNMEYWTDDC